MSDLYIFGVGVIVSLIVGSAVGLLLWGAANEPRGTLLPSKESAPTTAPPRSTAGEPASAPR